MSGEQHDASDSEETISSSGLDTGLQRRNVLKGLLGTSALAVGSPLLSERVTADPTPLASYDFEGSGSTLIDGSGNAHSGTLVRASRISGRGGTILQFEKTNDEYAELGTADSLDPGSGSYTVSLWFKSSSTTNKHKVLFAKRGDTNERFRITTRDQGQINFGLKDDPGASATRIVTSETYTDGAWHHVVAVRDTDQDTLELYVDDVLVGSVTDAENDVDPNGPAFLGGQPEYPNPRYYTGQIDDVKIYEAAVRPEEIPSETDSSGLSSVWSVALTNGRTDIRTVDLNDDGITEVAVADITPGGGPSEFGLLEDGAWTWKRSTDAAIGIDDSGDVDGDGQKELVFGARAGPNWVRPYTYDGEYEWSADPPDFPDDAAALDYDGDGKAEVGMTSNYNGHLQLYDDDGSTLWDVRNASLVEKLLGFRDVVGDERPELLTHKGQDFAQNRTGLQLVEKVDSGVSRVWEYGPDQSLDATFNDRDDGSVEVFVAYATSGEFHSVATDGTTNWSKGTSLSGGGSTTFDTTDSGSLMGAVWSGSTIALYDSSTEEVTEFDVGAEVRQVEALGNGQAIVAAEGSLVVVEPGAGVVVTETESRGVEGLAAGDVDGDGTPEAVVAFSDEVVVYDVTREKPKDQPELQLNNTRLFQGVENTRIDGGKTYDDEYDQAPPLVYGRNTTVAFGFDGTLPRSLDELQMQFEYEGIQRDTETVKFDLDSLRTRIDSVGGFEFVDYSETVTNLVTDGVDQGTDDGKFPVFGLEKGLTNVTVSLLDGSDTLLDQATTADSAAAEERSAPVEMPEINVGVISVGEPGNEEYGAVEDYQTRAKSVAVNIRRFFPTTEVNLYIHPGDDNITGTTISAGYPIDMWGAHEELERQFREDGNPSGTFYTITDKPIARKTTDSFDELDVRLLIAPDGYFTFHDRKGNSGLHRSGPDGEDGDPTSQPPLAAIYMENEDPCGENASTTGAHEAGHHFLNEPYDDEFAASEQNGGEAHAASGLRSDTLNLFGRPVCKPENVEQTPLFEPDSSLMKAGGGSGKDEFLFKEMTDKNAGTTWFTPEPTQGDELTNEELLPLLANYGKETAPEIAGILSPIPGTARYLDDDGDATVRTIAATGREITSISVPTEYTDVASSGAASQTNEQQFIPARVPYPEETYTIRVEIDDPESDETLTSEFTATGQQLRFLVERIPDAGFERPKERREAVEGKVSAIRDQIDAKAFQGAARKIENDLIPSLERWLKNDYPAAANEYTKDEAIEVAEDVRSRVKTLSQSNSGGRGNDS